MKFVSQDGRHHKWYDLSGLTGHPDILDELAVAFHTSTGPLGTYKRAESVRNLWATLIAITTWVNTHRAGISSLAQLTTLDARALAQTMVTPSGAQRLSPLRTLFGSSEVVTAQVRAELARLRFPQNLSARQPYTVAEARRIGTIARGIVRRARTRIRAGWALVDSYRHGAFDGIDELDPHRSLAEVLDHCAQVGDYPRSTVTGRYAPVTTRAATIAHGDALMAMLFLTPCEAWAFAVLLAGLTGYNASMLADLPAPAFRATAPGEPGIELLRLSKPRRRSRSEMTLPIDTVPRAFLPDPGDLRPARVRETSLTSALGVFTLLVELTEPARHVLGTDLALAYYAGGTGRNGGPLLRAGMPQIFRSQRTRWMRPWLTGHPVEDELLLGISLDRLRKTHLERTRRPVAHTPATFAGYLARMDQVTEDGFRIVREALDDEVAKALRRRRMTVTTDTEHATRLARDGQDTVLGACADFEHAPEDDQPCRRSFLSCLDCTNARAFPQHLPMQLVVLDELRTRQTTAPLEQRLREYAGRIAQLEDVIGDYEPAQQDQARARITDTHRHLAARLFAGDLDPL